MIGIMHLDINTPKGQISLKQEQYVLSVLRQKYPDKYVIQTPKQLDAKCDGIIVSNQTMCMDSVYEIKCRENLVMEPDGSFSYVSPKGIHYPETSWLITYEKIEACVDIATKLRIPFIGLLYLTTSNVCMQFHISDANGNYMFEFDVKNTNTQKTTNGGRINRDNAYLPFKCATQILSPSDFKAVLNHSV